MGAAANATPKQREKMDAGIFCGVGRTFPIQDAGDIRSAARLIGKADDPEAVKRCILRKAKNITGGMDAVPDAWKPASKDGGNGKASAMPDLIFMGSAVKALGEGKVGGHLVLYGDETTPDLSTHKDYFTAATEYDIEPGDKRGMYWAHGQDPKIGVKKIGTLTVTPDEHGLWVEGVLDMADKYQRSIYDLAEKGKLGWSSGAPSHLVTRKAVETKSGGTVHEILTWPIAEGSLTPTPADYRNVSYTIKSLADTLNLPDPAEDHTTKALPAGMSYDDLRAFLSDELNEDFPDTDDDGTDSWGPGLHIRDIYDDALVYSDEEDLYRIPYTVTSGNDVVWGTPESVIRTTVYVTATDGDDDAGEADAVPMSGMSGKQADVTALKEALTRSMTFSDHADIATSALSGFVTRAEGLTETSAKSGRVISAANRAKLAKVHSDMQVAHAAMNSHMDRLAAVLHDTDPDAKKDAEDFAALRTQFVRLQSELLSLSG